PPRRLDERVHRSAQPPRPRRGRRVSAGGAAPAAAPRAAAAEPVVRARDLRAYFRTRYFGVHREVRAVDGISFDVRRGEIYGLAGESSSGKTTLTKTIAGLVRPPLEVVGGSVAFSFLPGAEGLWKAPPREVERVRWRHLSSIMQASMNVLNPL